MIFLGDLFHSVINTDWHVCKTFLAGYPDIIFDLVVGNHDLLPREELDHTFNRVFQEGVVIGPFFFSHEPADHPDKYNICGHIHPAYKLTPSRRQPSVRLPCFYFDGERCILPAFGTFTGMHNMSDSGSSNIYVIADDEVIPTQ